MFQLIFKVFQQQQQASKKYNTLPSSWSSCQLPTAC